MLPVLIPSLSHIRVLSRPSKSIQGRLFAHQAETHAQRFSVPATTRAGDAVQHFQKTEGAKRGWMLESPNTNLHVFIRCESGMKKKKIISMWQCGETTGIKRPFTNRIFSDLTLIIEEFNWTRDDCGNNFEFYFFVFYGDLKKACERNCDAEGDRMGQASWILLD